MLKKLSLYSMAAFYLLAGINHFRNPEAYKKIIPPYFSYNEMINYASGLFELVFALLLLIPATKKFACYSIIAMLIAFFPVHIYMLATGWCIKDFCFPKWILWIRLLVFQPLLIIWAYYVSTFKIINGVNGN